MTPEEIAKKAIGTAPIYPASTAWFCIMRAIAATYEDAAKIADKAALAQTMKLSRLLGTQGGPLDFERSACEAEAKQIAAAIRAKAGSVE